MGRERIHTINKGPNQMFETICLKTCTLRIEHIGMGFCMEVNTVHKKSNWQINGTKSLHLYNSFGNMTHHQKLLLYHNQIRLWFMTNSNAVDWRVSLLHYSGTCPGIYDKAACNLLCDLQLLHHSSSLHLKCQTSFRGDEKFQIINLRLIYFFMKKCNVILRKEKVIQWHMVIIIFFIFLGLHEEKVVAAWN